MREISQKLTEKLEKRKENNAFRTLSTNSFCIDFSSNDYIGFSKNKHISERVLEKVHSFQNVNGSTGSRLISGNSSLYQEIEQFLANFHQTESALLFNSGYDANVGFFSSIPQRGDTILYDELVHASIRDGIRLSNANAFGFKHNDLESLKLKFQRAKGDVYIVVESIYSMDGDAANLKEIADFCQENNCYLIVDEAHSTGIYSENGKGFVDFLGLNDIVFARIHTFGKAIGCHGAVVLGTKNLCDYLVNFSRSFIYTTAMPVHSLLTIKESFEELKTTNAIEELKSKIQFFKETIKELDLDKKFIESESPIQCCVLSGNDFVKNIAKKLQENSINIKPILSPTVPKGAERLRFCIHSYNSIEEIQEVCSILKQAIQEFQPEMILESLETVH
ncbi:aminotransferase class I/II-fold pyridoxal phosphate-dependent enzyme [Aureivirga sp. CE67]|uniref:aminotransferase class I/II-fold pyridoxal phosphate-dependent enzyme n=1 Tax=Aureivirga sp. CE67 TaxID=1788983 RepID=UPI0018CB183D|nr:pyridoxal phosphate-dependent aminotransferase family protein [Aureivirga sp. CE67]